MISSVGPPPDLHAKRVVTEMLRYLGGPVQPPVQIFLRARGDLATNPLVSSCSCGKGLRR